MSDQPERTRSVNPVTVVVGGGVMLLVIIGLVVYIVVSHDSGSSHHDSVALSGAPLLPAPLTFSASQDSAFLQDEQITEITQPELRRVGSTDLIKFGHFFCTSLNHGSSLAEALQEAVGSGIPSAAASDFGNDALLTLCPGE